MLYLKKIVTKVLYLLFFGIKMLHLKISATKRVIAVLLIEQSVLLIVLLVSFVSLVSYVGT